MTGSIRLNRTIAWSLLIVAMLGNVSGVIFDLYVDVWWYDKALHCFFSFAITLVLALYVYGAILTGRQRHPLLLVLTIAGLGLALGALWEIAEWVYGGVGGPNSEIFGSFSRGDTVMDQVMDLTGGIVAGLLSLLMVGKRESTKIDRRG